MERVKGTIAKGLGEGAYFMSMGYYRKEIKKKLGFDPFQGTLNLEIEKNRDDLVNGIKPVKIIGFVSDNKTFGGASCYKAKIKNIKGAVILPEINKNPKNVIEFIAPVHVKSALNLKDNDEVEIEFL